MITAFIPRNQCFVCETAAMSVTDEIYEPAQNPVNLRLVALIVTAEIFEAHIRFFTAD